MSPTGTARTVLFITQGESLAYVKDQHRHSSISMTVDVYGHLVPGANRAAMDRLPTVEGMPEKAVETDQLVSGLQHKS